MLRKVHGAEPRSIWVRCQAASLGCARSPQRPARKTRGMSTLCAQASPLWPAPGKIRFTPPAFLCPEGGGVVIVALENPVAGHFCSPTGGALWMLAPADAETVPLVAPVSVSSLLRDVLLCRLLGSRDAARDGPAFQHLLDHVLERRHTCGDVLGLHD